MMDNMTPVSSTKDRNFESTSVSFQPGYQPPIVLVKKIPQTITDRDLQEAFHEFGHIKEISILQPKLYAYVEFQVGNRHPDLARSRPVRGLSQQVSPHAPGTSGRSLPDQCREK